MHLSKRDTNEIQKREITENTGELLRRSKPKKNEEKFRLFTGMSLKKRNEIFTNFLSNGALEKWDENIGGVLGNGTLGKWCSKVNITS